MSRLTAWGMLRACKNHAATFSRFASAAPDPL